MLHFSSLKRWFFAVFELPLQLYFQAIAYRNSSQHLLAIQLNQKLHAQF